MLQDDHVLIEMTSEPDYRFIGSWLMKVAETQTFWSEALRDPYFKSRVFVMCVWAMPHLECAALEILGALKQQDHVIAVDLNGIENQSPIFSTEFAMMVHLGFFVPAGVSYQMTVPESVTLEKVRLAALKVVSTEKDDEGVQPERLLNTLPLAEAEAWRCTRLALSHAGFRILERPLFVVE
ncbi:hypothetical protein [Bradyrhizobium sp. AZCC 2289]|uniref:hypothetical protein n=1 Tax=Bradyrhizobium sp. AZCC 2289 TaxID=3117026 RepID=UPI002FF013C6